MISFNGGTFKYGFLLKIVLYKIEEKYVLILNYLSEYIGSMRVHAHWDVTLPFLLDEFIQV